MKSRPVKVLVVDHDKIVLGAVTDILQRGGFGVIAVDEAMEGMAAAKDPSVDVALFDIRMPNLPGMDLLRAVKQARPELEVVMMTASATVEAAVEAVKAGAYDYLTKPLENIDEVTLTVGKAAERKALRDRTRVLEEALSVLRETPSGGAGGDAEVVSDAHLPYAEAKRLALRAFERRYLSALLERNRYNISSAARAAGVDRSNFRRLLKQYDVARTGADTQDPPTLLG